MTEPPSPRLPRQPGPRPPRDDRSLAVGRRSADDRALPAELRVLLTCVVLAVAALLCRATGSSQPRSLLLFVVVTVVACTGLPWLAAVLVGVSAWAVHTGFVVDRLGVLQLTGPRLSELVLFASTASLSWLAGRRQAPERPGAGAGG